ncbi:MULTISPECIES: HAD family hydrolase [Rhizobiaceae]|jgi:HAD superfamily hydrolase (TIGR01509 family)|uniref:HAD superfamily hydrolase (TIGR01509 family) n=1 Tax=Aliirhizobium cellulosilyticum TaxID=393664 RepID=A0A7W6Y3Q3_9HYPH|nr:HAD family hydrolase [Rhizobium cellulosilyticum]MBB4348403.1 HAD superfamily hydrolase (TIGR01509 family) [Rhizobium cellulosilyticum]MBB4411639.1 HAD superfamily hydrolase (TIGR01509 family) [Rhizobium cellulosilyticum]MBB4446330.1 HAD superfamily hydrolase (TIGR01509 family) [Rhizobium cellulosilyticum]
MSGFDLILFDCDGVLVDSEIIAARVESQLLTEAGYPISVEEMGERFAGMTWKNILLSIEKEADIPLSASLLDKSEKLLDARLERDVKIIEGVKFALARLTTQRCICSNSSSARLDMMLTKVGLKPYFAPHIYSAKDLGPDRVKPKPDIFLHGAQQFGVDPSRCLVVEDSTHGVHAARAAGMRVVGFTGASHTYPSHADRLTDAGAETVISRMQDLPAVVAALGEWADAI